MLELVDGRVSKAFEHKLVWVQLPLRPQKNGRQMIFVYNIHEEDHTNQGENNFYCGRSKEGNPLGNPFSFNGQRTNIAKLSFKTREEAVKAYGIYFDKMYGKDKELTKAFDEIYEKYKNGEDVYLGCFCKPKMCHADIIADRLQRKLIKEKLEEKKNIKQQ